MRGGGAGVKIRENEGIQKHQGRKREKRGTNVFLALKKVKRQIDGCITSSVTGNGLSSRPKSRNISSYAGMGVALSWVHASCGCSWAKGKG